MAMIGAREGLSRQDEARAVTDRELFGDRYMPRGERGFDRPVLVLRFMQEICRMPLHEAGEGESVHHSI